jgi:phytanoyl-CoA hydroxylase
MFRRLKIVYMIYNFFQKKKLMHNVKLYQKLGLNKFYFSPISSKDFKGLNPLSLQENKSFPPIENTSLFQKVNKESQASLLKYEQEGYAILKQYITQETVDKINQEIDTLIDQDKVKFKYGNRIMFAIEKSNLLRNIGEDKHLIELLSTYLKEDVKLFQSINFKMGSEQRTHSDSIHMTTFPQGGLFGVWIALEDIELDNGPLHYYPGSQQLPYYLNKDYDNEGNFFLIGEKDYPEYEKMIADKIREQPLEKKVFTAKAGDVLIWHANLFHGGEPHINKSKTRKSMVFHYYAVNRICYHEITQRPALMI